MKDMIKDVLYFVGLPVILVAVWWAATLGEVSPFVPRPGELVNVFVEVWFGGRFTSDVLPSLGRLGAGLGVAIVLGIALGLLVGSFRAVRSFLEPTLEFLRAVPPPVLVPILMLLVGIGDEMKVVVIALGCLWPILLNTVEGVRAVDDVLVNTSKIYRIDGASRLWHLTLRSSSPQIMAGVRQSLSLGLILMVISEMFASSSGLGFTIVQFQRSFSVPEMWSGIALLGIIGILLSFVFRFVERRILAWYHGLRKVEQ